MRQDQRVAGWRRGAWAPQGERPTPDVGRGRGAARRPTRGLPPTRAPLPRLARHEAPSAARRPRGGGTAGGTKAGPQRRSCEEAVGGSRQASRVARGGNRRQRRVQSAPRLVQRHDHRAGRPSRVTLGVRVWTGRACGRRRSLQQDQSTLPGWHPAHKTQRTDTPTAARILPACAAVALTRLTQAAGGAILRRRTPLAGGQEDLLPRLGVGTAL